MKIFDFQYPRKGDYDLTDVEVFIIDNLSDACDAEWYLEKESVLYVDCEGSNFGNTNSQQLALVQVATGPNRCFIFDVVECRSVLSYLKDIFQSGRITKVFHDCSGDFSVLSAYGIDVRNIYDTQVAQEVIEPRLKGGINKNYLSVKYSGKDMKTRSDVMVAQCQSATYLPDSRWFKRPMKESDLAYAVVDVLFLTEVFRRQKPLIKNWHAFQDGVDKKCKSKVKFQEQATTSSINWGKVALGVAIGGLVVLAGSAAAAAIENDKKSKKKDNESEKEDDQCTIS